MGAKHQQNGQTEHHVTTGVCVDPYVRATGSSLRRSHPSDAIYDLSKKVELPVASEARPTARKPKTSMFFKGYTARLDKDPFLQRLARLS